VKAAEPLSTFLQYLKYGYMIDNIVLMVTGAMHEREVTVNASFFVVSCPPQLFERNF
jgi:vacuolar-type H+-ATPase subunit C/Vma6